MNPIILIGGGGHCISCIDVIESTGLFTIMGILDTHEKVGQKVLDYPIIGTDDDIKNLMAQCSNFLITIGQIKSSTVRERIWNKVNEVGGNLPVIISPTAQVSSHAKLAEGTIVMHHALINAGASIGKACIINSKALIEHETTIGDFCHISTAAVVNGQANIGDNCFIGSNTVVGNNIEVVACTTISAGSQVLKNIELSGTYIGQPLRKIR